jgi:hypothetical protein
VPGALGRDHEDVDVGARVDQAEVDVETVGKGERGAGLHVRADVVGVDLCLGFIGGGDHDHVGPFGGFLVRKHLEACGLGLFRGGGAGAERDRDVLDAAVAHILRVRVTLAAIADNGDLLALDQILVGVAIVIDLHVILPC